MSMVRHRKKDSQSSKDDFLFGLRRLEGFPEMVVDIFVWEVFRVLAGNSNDFWRVNQMFDDEKLARTSFDRSNKTDSEYLTAVPIKSVQISAIVSSSAFYKLLPISQLYSCKFTTVNYC